MARVLRTRSTRTIGRRQRHWLDAASKVHPAPGERPYRLDRGPPPRRRGDVGIALESLLACHAVLLGQVHLYNTRATARARGNEGKEERGFRIPPHIANPESAGRGGEEIDCSGINL